MASKQFALDEELTVTVYKRRGNRHLRLTLSPSGQIRVSIPSWVPYRAGVDFARTRREWIRAQRLRDEPLRHGQAVGKAHHLQFVPKTAATSVNSRLAGTLITVSHPVTEDFASLVVQKAARDACIRALRRQAEQLLPQRLADLAQTHGFKYRSVKIKQLKSRWGSCDQHNQIVLNLFLMQLPWELIDYVLLHELTHTRLLRHGPDFWQAMNEVLPDTKSRRKAIKNYRPDLQSVEVAG